MALSPVLGGILIAGGVGAIPFAMLVGALPLSLLMVLTCAALIKAIIKDCSRARSGVQAVHIAE